MKRSDAIVEARRRWGDEAFVRGPRPVGARYVVGFTGGYPVDELAMGTGSTWAEAIAAADALRKQTGFERAYRQSGGIVVVVNGGCAPPSLAEAFTMMTGAQSVGVGRVEWRWRYPKTGNAGTPVRISFCACGNVTFGWPAVCGVCHALESTLLGVTRHYGADAPASDADLQARYEAADRYMDRVGAVIRELKQQLDKRNAERMVEIGARLP